MKTKYFLAAVIMLSASALSAESIFLKDGSIIEGKIQKETDAGLTVKTKSGEVKSIPRADVMRTLYDENYKKQKFIYRADGTHFPAYVIEESGGMVTYRKKLDSPAEEKISENEIDTISAACGCSHPH